jgi:hypothetical protein
MHRRVKLKSLFNGLLQPRQPLFRILYLSYTWIGVLPEVEEVFLPLIISYSYFRDLTGSAEAALIACQLIARKDTSKVSKPGIRKTIGPSLVWYA